MTGPATNITSLFVITKILGERAASIYLVSLAVFAVLCVLILDRIYLGFGLSAAAVVGQTGKIMPFWLQVSGAMVLLALSVKPLVEKFKKVFAGKPGPDTFHKHESVGYCVGFSQDTSGSWENAAPG
ncbi:MAG: hypothetical protein U9N19_10615 [Thermodesulfobacteriota bacterium]|nr:hypothetical protein [Thermodesulfobacteriota bacterium]